MSGVNKYAQYTTSDFDNFDCLKLSKGIWLLILFVLRAYLIWLMSVTNMNDRISVIQWIYPNPSFFYLSLFSGVFAFWAVILICLRRPNASQWVRRQWEMIRWILLFSLIFDFSINFFSYFYWQFHSPIGLIANGCIILLFTWYLFTSNRVKINIGEFPESLPE